MKRYFTLALLAISFFACANSLPHEIELILNDTAPNTPVGIMVKKIDGGEVVYARRAQERFVPASTTKLFTAYSAFKHLGPDFTFDTTVYQSGDNVVIRFVGDPTFSDKDLTELFQKLSNQGITTISGDIIIDNTVFEKPYYARGWTYDSLNWDYSAPLSSVMLNQNAQDILLQPSKSLNKPAKARLVSPNPGVKITSDVTTVTFEESLTTCQLNVSVSDENHIHLYGCWPQNQPNQSLKIALSNPEAMVKSTLPTVLKNNGITHTGKIITGATPRDAKPLTTHASRPLSEIMSYVVQDSKNFYTEPFTKMLGARLHKQASFQDGSYAIMQDAIQDLGLDENDIKLHDGSGASSYDGITPAALAAILIKIQADSPFKEAYEKVMARPGEPGTLQYRMRNLPAKARFQGKTGTLLSTNSSTLAGTMYNKDGEALAVVIMSNHGTCPFSQLRAMEDKLVELIYSYPHVN